MLASIAKFPPGIEQLSSAAAHDVSCTAQASFHAWDLQQEPPRAYGDVVERPTKKRADRLSGNEFGDSYCCPQTASLRFGKHWSFAAPKVEVGAFADTITDSSSEPDVAEEVRRCAVGVSLHGEVFETYGFEP